MLLAISLPNSCATETHLLPPQTEGPIASTTSSVEIYVHDESLLTVDGLVDLPLKYNFEDVARFPAVTIEAILYCPGVYENQPLREWSGTPVSSIINASGLKPEASRLIFYASDGYKTTISIEKIISSGAILAYEVDGDVLSKGDGYPFRLVAADFLGDVWIRWVNRIEIA
jgi:DMSO/TMAO reductase YedYZ molybdopterin-dependent catalytic subunit